MDAKLSEDENPEAIAQEGQGDHRGNEYPSPHRSLQEKVGGHQAGDQQNQARMNPAAFRRNHQRESGHLKMSVGLKHRHAAES